MKLVLLSLSLLSSTISILSQDLFPYKNPALPIEARVNDLVSRMTLKEKVSQMVYNAPAIERLGIPKYNW